jgi:MFS family permease
VPTPTGGPRRAAFAGWIGSALEYYDFFIYGSAAALIFPKIFFSSGNPHTATLVSLATFGVAYAARPVGAFAVGHYGDRMGRRAVLLATVGLMGVATFLIGCLPTYRQIGLAAPILLVLLRILQGLSASGEQAGANSMTLEHAPGHRRGFYTSFTLNGTQAGQIIGTLLFIPIAALPEHSLLTWGWRIPFLVSAVITIAGVLVRRRLQETPVFAAAAAEGRLPRAPLAELLRDNWAGVLRVIGAALIATVSTIITVWSLSYGADTEHLDKTALLWVTICANLAGLAAIPGWAILSDRIGRKPVFLIGSLGSGVTLFAYLWAISIGSYPLIFLTGILCYGVVYSAANGVWPVFYGEMFSARVRLSGMAVGTQIGFAIAGFAVSFASAIAGPNGNDWPAVAGFTAVLCVISSVAALTARETFRIPTEELGSTTHSTTTHSTTTHSTAPAGSADAGHRTAAGADSTKEHHA